MRCTSEQRNKQNPLDLISVITEMVESGGEIQENRWMDELEEEQTIKSNFNSGLEEVWSMLQLLILGVTVKHLFGIYDKSLITTKSVVAHLFEHSY